MDSIKQKIGETIENLKQKKSLLEDELKVYLSLKEEISKYPASQIRTIRLNLSSRSRLRNDGKDGDYSNEPISAVDQEVAALQKAIDEFNARINEAGKTIENINELLSFEATKSSDDNSVKEGEINGEEDSEAQFMEIREELDEEGNVIESSVKPQTTKALNQLTSEASKFTGINDVTGGSSSGNDRSIDEDMQDEMKELLKDMEIYLNSDKDNSVKSEQITEIDESDDDLDLTIKERTVINKTTKPEPKVEIAQTVQPSTKTSNGSDKKLKSILKPSKNADPKVLEAERLKSEYYALLNEMGIFNVDPNHFATVEETTEDSNQEPLSQSPEESTLSNETFAQSINQDDILQLQIIDSELDDLIPPSDDDDDNEEEEIDFEKLGINVEGDEDDDEDWDFHITEDQLVPGPHKDLFLAELSRLREQQQDDRDDHEDVISVDLEEKIQEIDALEQKKKAVNNSKQVINEEVSEISIERKKSVSFAEELEQVKEIENVSEQLKESGNIKVSKFKRARNLFRSFAPSDGTASNITSSLGQNAVSESIVENDTVSESIIEENDTATTETVVEKDNTVSELIVEKEIPTSYNDAINETIIEKDITETPPIAEIKPKRQSRFKSSRPSLQGPKKPEMPILPSANDAKPVSELNESKVPQKVSKFKSSMSSLSKSAPPVKKQLVNTPVAAEVKSDKAIDSAKVVETKPQVIKVPESKDKEITKEDPVFAITPETDYDTLKQYVTNSDDEEGEDQLGYDDEELLDNLTNGISVYRGDDIEAEIGNIDEDDQEEDDYDEDDDDYGPIVLDEIVENEDVDDPDYFINDGLLKKEYFDLRKKMLQKYGESELMPREKNEETNIIKFEEEGEELEPIDENGNPLKVSRFRKSLERK